MKKSKSLFKTIKALKKLTHEIQHGGHLRSEQKPIVRGDDFKIFWGCSGPKLETFPDLASGLALDYIR